MKYEIATLLVAYFGLSTSAPLLSSKSIISIPRAMLRGREVPQEHSHNRFLDGVRVNLNINNPAGIEDPVFGLLGDQAAAAGAGTITNLECLHQITADQAFTNAKAAGNVTGQADALMYAALERNTGAVGLASVLCNETAVNPEIEAVTQHQDPASPGATATNKAIVLELAKQLQSIGADPQEALLSGTFAPGTIGDPTAAGNTCDVVDDVEGCIFSQNLLVDDATPAEIYAAVSGIASASAAASASTASVVASASAISSVAASSAVVSATVSTSDTADTACSVAFVTVTGSASVAPVVADTATVTASTSASAITAASGTNLQTFTGKLGGPPPPVFSSSGERPFTVNGNTFVNAAAAIQRSCSIQNNACADVASSGNLTGETVGDCNTQETACNAAAPTTKKRAALDFGTCTNPSIDFENGLDGRNQPAFIPNNLNDFVHGSALNIDVIASFICQRLGSPCNAPGDTISACTAATAAAAAAGGTTGASATAFNSALGLTGGEIVRSAAVSIATSSCS